MVGGLCMIVLSFKFDQNRLSGYRDCRGQNLGFCITLANGLYSPVHFACLMILIKAVEGLFKVTLTTVNCC